jgi:hypothetical protein
MIDKMDKGKNKHSSCFLFILFILSILSSLRLLALMRRVYHDHAMFRHLFHRIAHAFTSSA